MGKIAAISDDLNSDFSGAARVAADLGLDGLAVRHVNGTNVRNLGMDELRRIRHTADGHGLVISALSSPFGRNLHLDDDDEPARKLLEHFIRQADALGTPLLRIFAFWVRGKDPLPEWSHRPFDGAFPAGLVERVSRFAEQAKRAGVTLMLELEGASYVGRVEEAARLLRAVNSDSIALCWDVCNGWWSGEDPWESGWPIARTLPIVDVQTKDVAARPDDGANPTFEQVVLGAGAIRYADIVSALVGIGYDGWFTAERVYHPRKPEADPRLRADIASDIANLQRLVSNA